jgi:hypothetical protein
MTCILHFSAFRNDYRQPRSIIWTDRHTFNPAQHEHSIQQASKHDMLAVQKVTLFTRDEELRSICVGPTVCLPPRHG